MLSFGKVGRDHLFEGLVEDWINFIEFNALEGEPIVVNELNFSLIAWEWLVV